MNAFRSNLAMLWQAARWAVLCAVILALEGCDDGDMNRNGRIKPLEHHAFFENGQSARPPVEGTVPRGASAATRPAGQEKIPFAITRDVLERGRERYNIYCSVCHGLSGAGDGMIVRRGFTAPPTFHSDRLRAVPDSHFVDVMTNGFGAMYSYSDRVMLEDRWKIAAYIRALQLSQHVKLAELPEALRKEILESKK